MDKTDFIRHLNKLDTINMKYLLTISIIIIVILSLTKSIAFNENKIATLENDSLVVGNYDGNYTFLIGFWSFTLQILMRAAPIFFIRSLASC